MTNSQSKLLKALAKGPGHPIETVADALDHIAALTKASAELLEAFEQRVSELEGEIREATSEIEELTEARDGALNERNGAISRAEEAEYALEHEAEELARAVQQVRAGRIDDALYALEKILSTIDPGCKARVTARAVML